MGYNYSDIDNRNLAWFPKYTSRATLLTIQILLGKIRGLGNFSVDFRYPITAIAGRNGSGKTTILSLAACAYHNSPKGFRLPGRKTSYYTFSDFFVQASDEASVGGIIIEYKFLYDHWRPSKSNPTGIGPGRQRRVKMRRSGRWNNYDRRVERTVVYLGIDRIVPHAERSAPKNSRKLFQPAKVRGWEAEVQVIVGRILGLDYNNFGYRQHSKYRLPIVTSSGAVYSGFNMGAGEDSLFEFFSIIKECPDGSLLLIDEIELGLHEEAQARLIQELKALCNERKFQVICTTHSPRILECLPPEGRVFLERVGNKTYVTPGISPAYATGKLSGRPSAELDILVEDESAQLIVETALTQELRLRVRVIPIGSSVAVMRHLAARYKERRPPEVCVLLDGDKSSEAKHHIKEFLDALEKPKDKEQDTEREWAEGRLGFLPSTEWPEAWVVSHRSEAAYKRLEGEFQLSRERADDLLNAARRAGKHNEFYEAAKILNFDQTIVTHQLIKGAFESAPGELQKIVDFIQSFLR